MRKIPLVFFCFLFVSVFSAPGQAQTEAASRVQNIRLKDGTFIKGRVISQVDGIYTIQSPALGRVKIKASEIKSLSGSGTAPSSAGSPAATVPLSPGTALPQMSPEIQDLQNKMFSDPEITALLQEIASDPSIQKLVQDPEVMQAALRMDPEKVQNNPNVRQLLRHPKMQRLMELITQKISFQNGPGTGPKP